MQTAGLPRKNHNGDQNQESNFKNEMFPVFHPGYIVERFEEFPEKQSGMYTLIELNSSYPQQIILFFYKTIHNRLLHTALNSGLYRTRVSIRVIVTPKLSTHPSSGMAIHATS